MIVRPIQAALIRDCDLITRMDPFCRIYHGGECLRTAVCHNGGKTPRWGESFPFPNSEDQILRVEVWDYDKIGSDELIGAGSLNIPYAIGQGGGNSIWVDLFYDDKVAGRICLSITMNNGMMNQNIGMNQGIGMNLGMGINQGMNIGINNPQNNVGWSNNGQPGGYNNNGGW